MEQPTNDVLLEEDESTVLERMWELADSTINNIMEWMQDGTYTSRIYLEQETWDPLKIALVKHLLTHLATLKNKLIKEVPLTDKVPKKFHKFLHVFDEDRARQLPPYRPYIRSRDRFATRYGITAQESLQTGTTVSERIGQVAAGGI